MNCKMFGDGSAMTEKERAEIEIREELFVRFFARLLGVTDVKVALSKGAREYVNLCDLLRRDIGRSESAVSLIDYE